MGMKLIVIDKRISLILIFFFGFLSQNLFSKTLLEPKDEFFVKKLEYQSERVYFQKRKNYEKQHVNT